jgi:hypothetical protein
MNAKSFDLLWRVLSAGISGYSTPESPTRIEDIYATDIELPPVVEKYLVDYVVSKSPDDFSALVTELVRRFELAQEDPTIHLLLLGYLVAKRHLPVREAVRLAQVFEGLSPSSNKDVFELSNLAERVEEEERIGFMSVDEDHFFEENLASFCSARGFIFSPP